MPHSLLCVQVLMCLADLASLPAQPLLLTITGRVLGTPQQRRTRSGDSLITIKLDDNSLAGVAAFRPTTRSCRPSAPLHGEGKTRAIRTKGSCGGTMRASFSEP